MSKLNPVAQKWVEALRSGEYKQAKGALRKGDKRCCLGVLCDLSVKAKVISRPSRMDHGLFLYAGNAETLPTTVQQWAGLKSAIGLFNNEGNCLSRENDLGATFAEIADLIEQHADELFEVTA